MVEFKDLLGQHVKASRMKQVSIASDAGISNNYLGLLLRGTRHPSEQVVATLARALKLEDQQFAELLASAGYAPSVAMIHRIEASSTSVVDAAHEAKVAGRADHLAQQYYALAKEIPDSLSGMFFEEMRHLIDYARYKYLLCGGANLTTLKISSPPPPETGHDVGADDSLNFIATIVSELSSDGEALALKEPHGVPQASPLVAEMLSSIDQLVGGILVGNEATVPHLPHLVAQIREVLRTGAPWELRRRVSEAIPGISKFDAAGALQILQCLRNDTDERYGVDIRRRVVEAVVPLFDADPSSYQFLLDLLCPVPGDDIYVALASIEACSDILQRLKFSTEGRAESASQLENPCDPTEIGKIQRMLITERQGNERECLQFSLGLYELLCAPEALMISLREGLNSPEKLLQLVAVRYLERLLPLRPLEALQFYLEVLQHASSRNVRRNIVRALPALLRCLQETSLVARTLARKVVHALAEDSDIHIRRTVADYAMKLFYVDREFLLTILRQLHQDRDPAIRDRLQPVALRLAQLWLVWYAETAGLVRATKRKGSATPFGE